MTARDPSTLTAVGLAALALAPVQIVIAAEYLSIEQAQKSLFAQADRFSEVILRSEEHTSELQSQSNLVCRLLLEKKKPGFVSKNPRRHCHELGYVIYTKLLLSNSAYKPLLLSMRAYLKITPTGTDR